MPQISRGSSSKPTFGHEVLLLVRSTSVRELVNVSRMRPTAEYGDPHPQGCGRADQRAIYTHLPCCGDRCGAAAPPPRQSSVRLDKARRCLGEQDLRADGFAAMSGVIAQLAAGPSPLLTGRTAIDT